jgi:transcriptional regulator with GAF, ATPase, and Fis domain
MFKKIPLGSLIDLDPAKAEGQIREAIYSQGTVDGAAMVLGCTTRTLYRWMKRLGITLRER